MTVSVGTIAAEIPNVMSLDLTIVGTQLSAFAQRAVSERYSVDRPLKLVSDIQGNGTNYIPLPVASTVIWTGTYVPVFDPGASVIETLEFPIGQQPPQLILDSDFRVYFTPGIAPTILINFDTPGPDDFLRCSWTAKHLWDGSSVPEKDFYAIVDYAASLAADWLAAWYVRNGDPTISADVVNYRSKSSEMLKVSAQLRKRYYNHMGVEEGASGEAEVGPAFAIGNQYLQQNSGVDRLVHDKYSR